MNTIRRIAFFAIAIVAVAVSATSVNAGDSVTYKTSSYSSSTSWSYSSSYSRVEYVYAFSDECGFARVRPTPRKPKSYDHVLYYKGYLLEFETEGEVTCVETYKNVTQTVTDERFGYSWRDKEAHQIGGRAEPYSGQDNFDLVIVRTSRGNRQFTFRRVDGKLTGQVFQFLQIAGKERQSVSAKTVSVSVRRGGSSASASATGDRVSVSASVRD